MTLYIHIASIVDTKGILRPSCVNIDDRNTHKYFLHTYTMLQAYSFTLNQFKDGKLRCPRLLLTLQKESIFRFLYFNISGGRE